MNLIDLDVNIVTHRQPTCM